MAKTKSSNKKFPLSKPLFKIKSYLLPISLFLLLIILIFVTYQVIFLDKYYPFIFLGDTNVTFLTKAQTIRVVNAKFSNRANQKLPFGQFNIDLATSSAKLDFQIVDEAFGVGHSGPFGKRAQDQLQALISKLIIKPKVTLNLDEQIEIIAASVYQPPQNAQLIFDETTTPEGSSSANIQIIEAKDGLELDKQSLQKEVSDYLIFGKYQPQLPTKIIPPKITTDHVQRAKQTLESSQKQPVSLVFLSQKWVIDTKQLLTLLDLTSGQNLILDKDKTYQYLEKIASAIDQKVQEGLFEFNPATKRVTAFKPSQEGRKLDTDKTYMLLNNTFASNSSRTINLPVTIVKPKIQTSDVNSLGIKELLGRGISNFAGSIPNRIYNIGLAASRINGVLIAPGQTFSFNEKVGDISAASGYKQAYVIKSGRTVLDDGGGVCQDSTTLFRAVLNAGLPVVQRTAHAYRVGYYEQGFPPGLDATVFAPSVDFKFKNDTSAHILIQAYTVGSTLYVDLYGTSDGRIVNITKPIVTNQTPPPAELRQDDPTLTKGEVKQVDWPAWGANVSFSRTVVRDGKEIIKETFRSNFKAWQAVYLVGTKEGQ
ncbi:VanW family protein [Candidatus Microgenomates bacterium]|nr:VanW family protein [Candidatus Microgenomates bacterium]